MAFTLNKNVTNLTTASAATYGISVLTGFTYVAAPSGELPTGSVSTGYLCQTSDGATATIRIDPTSGAGSPFNGGGTYYRMSLMVRCVKTDDEVGTAPSEATLFDLKGDSGFVFRSSVKARYVAPSASSPDLSRYAASVGALLIHLNPVSASYGAEGSINHTEAGAVYRSSAGSATAPSAGLYNANMPFNQWFRLDALMDLTLKRFYLCLNGLLIAVRSMDTVDAPSTDWLVTFPAWAGFRWHLCEFSSGGGDAPGDDTGLSVITNSRNWKVWGLSPTFAPYYVAGNAKPLRLAMTGTNITTTVAPLSLGSGNRPLKEPATHTTTSSSGVVVAHVFENMPIVWNEEGVFHCCFFLRLGGITWTGGFYFTGLPLGSKMLNVAYSGGAYQLTDLNGGVIATFAQNEQIFVALTMTKSGGVSCLVYNNSKDFNPSGLVNLAGSASLPIPSSDVAPSGTGATLSLCGLFAATNTGDKMSCESYEGYQYLPILLTDSFTEAALQGTTAYDVTTFATAARCTVNYASLLNVAAGAADCNTTGNMCYPSLPNAVRWAFPVTFGRSGKKITAFESACLNGMRASIGKHIVVIGGLVNDVGGASTAPLADSISTNLAQSFYNIAKHCLDTKSWFTWVRPTFPASQPNNSYPASPLNAAYACDCYHRAVRKITDKLNELRRIHPYGGRCAVVDPGFPDTIDGVHWGNAGTLPAMTNAAIQLAALNGSSLAGTAQTISGQTIRLRTGGRQRLPM